MEYHFSRFMIYLKEICEGFQGLRHLPWLSFFSMYYEVSNLELRSFFWNSFKRIGRVIY